MSTTLTLREDVGTEGGIDLLDDEALVFDTVGGDYFPNPRSETLLSIRIFSGAGTVSLTFHEAEDCSHSHGEDLVVTIPDLPDTGTEIHTFGRFDRRRFGKVVHFTADQAFIVRARATQWPRKARQL